MTLEFYAAATAAILYHDDDDFASIVLKVSQHDLSCGAERWQEEAEEEKEEEVQQLYHALQAQSSQNSCLCCAPVILVVPRVLENKHLRSQRKTHPNHLLLLLLPRTDFASQSKADDEPEKSYHEKLNGKQMHCHATFFFFVLFELDDSIPRADDNWRSWRSHDQRDKPTIDACWFYRVNLQAH
jgi:hypothetical protein